MKTKSLLTVIFAIFFISTGCSVLETPAPLEDGLYLRYDFDGSPISVSFKKLDGDRFQATISPGDFQEVVNTRMKKPNGAIFELGTIGPIWISPSSVKVGGNAYGSRVSEVKHWERWEIGVVKASFGMGGAIRGEWYYERTTGFLVGGTKSTALSIDGSVSHFILMDSNCEGL
ncbi:hypothetical protein JXI42_10545 [bacterium]|nr:hypothetical protein [bacterium]